LVTNYLGEDVPANAREQAVLDKYKAQTAAEKTPRIKVSHDKKATAISLDHPDGLIGYALLTEALGTVDSDFVNGLLTQLGNASSQDQRPNESAINFLLSVIKGAKPKDQFEAMLAAQMAAIHTATMAFTRRLANVETIEQQIVPNVRSTNWRGPSPCKWRRSSATAPAASRRSRCSTYRSMRAGRRSSAT
jgi:hypothetical protein